MTDFEKTIKREMTRGKFEEIRGHVYGDGENTYDYTYGDAASWLTWNRDEKGEIADKSEESPVPGWAKNGHYYDGPIEEWDDKYASKITTDIVFLGLNMSGDGGRSDYPVKFQNARGHRRIVKTFFGTEAEGAYFTDIIKSDKRILDELAKKGEKPKDSGAVVRIVKTTPNILKSHIELFKKELGFIGAKKPLLIIFGGGAEGIIKKGFKMDYIKESSFHAVVKIYHYAYDRDEMRNDDNWHNDTRQKLSEYITIPESYSASETGTKPEKAPKPDGKPKNKGKTEKLPASPNDLQQKLRKVKEALEKKGFTIYANYDEYALYSEEHDGTIFYIVLNSRDYRVDWLARQHNDEKWFNARGETISEWFPGSKVRRRGVQHKLGIPVDQDKYLESIVAIIEKTSGTMGYYR